MWKYSYNKSFDLTLDNLLDFIHVFLEDNVNSNAESYKDIVFHLESTKKIERMRQILALEETGAIYILNLKFERENRFQDFENAIEKYRLYDEKDIIYHLTKEPNLIGKIKNKLRIPNRLDLLKIFNKKEDSFPTEFYSSKGIYRDWNNFKKNITRFEIFTCDIVINPTLFFQAFFDLVYLEQEDSVSKIAWELYENISSEIWGKSNFKWEIEIFYQMRKYLDFQSSIYPILKELKERELLDISKVYIKDWNLYFIIKNINNFSLEECEKAYNWIKRNIRDIAEFKNNDLYINNEIVSFRWKSSKLFTIIKMFFEICERNTINNISFSDLEDYYKEKWYTGLNKTKFQLKPFDDALKDFNVRVKDEYNIPVFIRVTNNWLECQYAKKKSI